MRIAYKGFNADLTCTMGKGTFQYEPGKWYEEKEANCVKNGFHCASNPLDCLDYYGAWDRSQYWVVVIDGDMDEDGTNTKISATKIMLVKRLDMVEFLNHAITYIIEHPELKMNSRVKTVITTAKEDEKFVIVRGKDPVAKAVKTGQYIALIEEELHTNAVAAAGLYYVDGVTVKPGIFYDVDGRERQC